MIRKAAYLLSLVILFSIKLNAQADTPKKFKTKLVSNKEQVKGNIEQADIGEYDYGCYVGWMFGYDFMLNLK